MMARAPWAQAAQAGWLFDSPSGTLKDQNYLYIFKTFCPTKERPRKQDDFEK